ncbi:RNA polymerase sigma factor [Bizionia paragorgiae]|uniref:RNA polymerase sigma-70 factor, ECF subfamily n=1 Tax=Bizionia paragorgiae TaxID=283786 RepID=A0A1H3YBH0_BIZPA|nr:RNA polymerase sigma factor [Bizionia paragorgiae]MDX1270992.1 RNA polymerase sigma factor [Bizionia paragorgiae]SEA08268.1 RNA polymerase sigma-70 factor, ECF subfamily [Bizionia paragorgiae]
MTQSDFLTIVTPFKDKVFRLAKRLLVSTEEAEDATQEVMIKLWKNKKNIKNYKNVEAFSMTMTKNFCYDKLKSKQAQNLKIVHNNYEDTQVGLQKQLEDSDSLDWVGKIMNGLPEQQKLIVQLRDIEQYEFKEIAQMLDMNETAIRVALSRARKTIKEQLTNTHNYGIK